MLDPHALPLASLLSVLCWISFFVCFLFLKKKKKIWFPRGRFVGLSTPPGGGEARRSALLRRPSGVSSEKGALCGGRAGGQGPGHRFPLLVYSARTDGSFCRLREGRGLQGNPWGLRKSAPPPFRSGSDASLSGHTYLVVPPNLTEKLLELGGELARKQEAVTEPLNGRGRGGEVSFAWISSPSCIR